VRPRALLDLLLPPACLRCGREGCRAALCAGCLRAFPGAPPDPAAAFVAAGALDACVSRVPYAGEVETWLARFKYPPAGPPADPAPERILALWLGLAAERAPGAPPDRVIPVPLHPARLRARGFNPAGLLARRLARARGLAFDYEPRDWSRLVYEFGDAARLIHPHHETGARQLEPGARTRMITGPASAPRLAGGAATAPPLDYVVDEEEEER